MTLAAQAVPPLPSVHSLGEEERKALVRETYARQSRFQREFKTDAAEFDCGAIAHELRGEIVRLLIAKGVAVPEGNLEQLHRHIGPELRKYGLDDGVNKVSSLLYDTDDAFTASYHRFIAKSVAKHFPYPFYFQATPTVRVHCPDGENSHHYPRYHTDIGYGHPPEEINIWMPLTEPAAPQYHGFRRTDVAHSRDILTQFGFDFAPFIERAVRDRPFNIRLNDVSPQVTTPMGAFTAFDSRSIHTGEPLALHTRVSIDIRIMPVEDFNALPVEYQGTGRRRMRYVPGQGYHSLSSDKL
jgi:hypothetical protein